MTRGDVARAFERMTGGTVDTALPQSFHDDASELLGENALSHFAGWAYFNGQSIIGWPIPTTIRGWEVMKVTFPHLFDE